MNSTWSTLENSTFFQNTTTKTISAEKTNSVLSGTSWDHKKTEDKNKNIIEAHFEATASNNNASPTKRTTPVNIESVWKLKNSTSVPPRTETSKSSTKTSWSSEISEDRDDNDEDTKDDDLDLDGNDLETNADAVCSPNEPAHHSRRPMNAFLIFCKCHRPVVRQKYPQLENRGVTKILGEWWAQLETEEKTAYQDLAKQYKDAFFKANPNFRWYKLPAPPLRTLNTRPGNVSKSPEPKPTATSPTSLTPLATYEAEFTPGKLADESQLGSITSLMNMDGQHPFPKSSSNSKRPEETFSPQFVTVTSALPPKPIKKRFIEHVVENRNVSRNIFNETTNADGATAAAAAAAKNNMTHQELIEKVVDNLCSSEEYGEDAAVGYDSKKNKEAPRKSGRSCKGKRYEKFMVEGKLLGNKKDKKHKNVGSVQHNQIALDLEQTIKRLAERTKTSTVTTGDDSEHNNNSISNNNNGDVEKPVGRERTVSETESSETGAGNNYRASDFNLEAKIKALPNLSFDKFLMKKKLAKKKKPAGKARNGEDAVSGNVPVGSRKRKANKHITRIPSPSNDLSGLATLAEVAAKTAKLDQQ